MSDLGNAKVFSKNLQTLMERYGKDRVRLCEDLGINYTTFANWYHGTKYPRIDKIELIANYFGVLKSDLIEDKHGVFSIDEQKIDAPFIRFPIIGNIAAGFDNEAVMEYTGEYAYFSPQDVHIKADDYFCLRIKGDSMYPRLLDGDIVLVHKQPSVDSGDIAVIMYNSDDATVKKVNYVYGEDWLELIPFNPEYQVKRIENADLELCRVLGKVVKLQRDV